MACKHPQEGLRNSRGIDDEYTTTCTGCGAASDGGVWVMPCDELCHTDFDSGQPDHSYACEERNEQANEPSAVEAEPAHLASYLESEAGKKAFADLKAARNQAEANR